MPARGAIVQLNFAPQPAGAEAELPITANHSLMVGTLALVSAEMDSLRALSSARGGI